MDNQELSHFQATTERELVSLLAELGRRIDVREILSGTIPFFSKEPQTALRLRSGDIEVLLVDEEASSSIGGGASRFERADFDSLEQLRAALLDHVRKEVSHHE
jgi:hypothetical protein